MTRRMIDSSMWSNENFAALPAMARLLQVGMINHADDQGRIKANPLYLAKEIFPYDRVTATNVSKWLEQIALNGTIILYAVEGKQYAQLTKWWEYQSLQYAAPSEYPAPPSWKDRIRRTATKGLIVTYNWTLGNGITVEDTCDEHGKPLAPTPKPKQPQAPPANTNGHSPDYSPESPPEHSNKLNLIEDQLNSTKEKGDRAREPFRSLPTNGEYLPGVPLPRGRRVHYDANHMASQRDKLGLTAAQLTELTDAVLERMNATEIAALDTDIGNDELRLAQEAALALAALGHKSAQAIGALYDSWFAVDYRGIKGSPPTYKQIVEHAKSLPTMRQPSKASETKLSEADKSRLVTRARTAQSNIRTAEYLKSPVQEDWKRDIEVAKGYGLI